MTDASLTQADADALLAMEKRCADATKRNYPSLGGRITAPLISLDEREQFFLDLWRSRINLRKGKFSIVADKSRSWHGLISGALRTAIRTGKKSTPLTCISTGKGITTNGPIRFHPTSSQTSATRG